MLVGGMPRRAAVRLHRSRRVFAGRWLPDLDSLLAQPVPPERPRVDGAEVAAALLLDMM